MLQRTELVRRKAFAKRDQIISGQFYSNQQSQSLGSWISSKIYSNTFGYIFGSSDQSNNQLETTDDDEIVNIELLNQQCNKLLNFWKDRRDNQIMSERELRIQLSNIKVKDLDIDIMFSHLKHSDKMSVEEVQTSGYKVNMIKLGHYEQNQAPIISEKEKATFVLEQNIKQIEESIDRIKVKIQNLTEDIARAIKMKSQRNGIQLLAQKKKLESFWERLTTQKHMLETQLMNIEELSSQSVIYDALNLAEQTGKTLTKDLDQYEDLFDKMEDLQQQQKDTQSLFKEKAISKEEEFELQQELDQLEAQAAQEGFDKINVQNEPLPTIKQRPVQEEDLDQQLRKLQEELEGLQISNDDDMQSVSTKVSGRQDQNEEQKSYEQQSSNNRQMLYN
eukprot:403374172